ncbi:MAG: hypothetical protein IJ497_01915 [Clostridia bacterium]|nr:hypothetical protein [Clostridia bacterium]
MEIKVIVELPGIPEALNNLANALTNQALKMTAYQTVIPAAPNSNPAEIDGSNVSAVEQAAPAPVTEPAVEEVAAPATPAPVLPQIPAADPAPMKKYTREEIATAGSALVTQGKMNELLALLQKYGVQSVAQLGEAQYGAFAADLKALGAAL